MEPKFQSVEVTGYFNPNEYMSKQCIDGRPGCEMIGCLCSCHDEKSEKMEGDTH